MWIVRVVVIVGVEGRKEDEGVLEVIVLVLIGGPFG